VAIIPVKPIAKALGKNVDTSIKAKAEPIVDPVIEPTNTLNIPEDEITAWHGSPHDFPPVTEIISHKTGERVLVDKNQYPDWTKHPDIEPSDYDFAGDYALGKFDSSKIGTGEGAQAYGHGLYFAQRKGTAESYQQGLRKASINKETPQLSRTNFNNIPRNIDSYLPSKNKENFSLQSLLESNKSPYFKSGKVTNAEAYLYSFFNDLENAQASRTLANFEINARLDEYEVLKAEFQNPSPVGSAEYNKAESIASKLDFGDSEKGLDAKIKSVNKLQKAVNNIDLSKFESGKGSLMEVKIRAREEEFLDFDAILDDQEFALQLLESDRGNFEWALDAVYNEGIGFNPTGRDLLAVLSDNFDPSEVSASLNKIGIKGIKYKDAQTRFSSKGATYNYVVFDDKLVSIANKYSVSLFAAGSISLGLMTPEQAMAQENPIGAPQPRLGTEESANDDLSGDFLAERESVDLTPAQIARQQIEAEAKAATPTPEPSTSGAMAVAKDIGFGLLEAPKQIVAGFLDATAEAAELLESIIPLEGGKATTTRLEEAETVTGGLVRGVSQFLTGFLPALKGAKGLGLVKSAPYAAGFVADATVFDPYEARLSDLIQEYPALQNPVTEYLQADPTDSEIEGRFKSGIEGLGLGGLTDGLIKAVKVIKASKTIKIEADKQGVTVEEFIGPVQIDEATQTLKMAIAEEPEFIPFDKLADESSAVIPTPFKMGSELAPDEAAKNINLNRLDTTEDVKDLLDAVADASPLDINNARRQKITQRETEALADDLGMEVEDLLARRAGEALNAEQAVAARKLLVASGANLIKLSNTAKTGGNLELALFRRAMSQHRAIQLQVAGMTAEAGRALQSFRIIAGSGLEQERAIKEALEATGGLKVNQEMAQMMSEITDPNSLGKFVAKANKATTSDMLYEIWINSLLSNPATHAVNMISNATVVVSSVIERKVASWIGSDVAAGEASAQMKGIVEGAKDGWKLAAKALRTGESTDPLTKLEVQHRSSISASNLELSGGLGRAANYIGSAVRTPGRFLLAGDELFKAIGYRMELQSLAYRKAYNEGLEPEAFAKRVQEILDNPPANIRLASTDAARYQTFTNPLGDAGQSLQKIRDQVPFGRLVVPFLRTPVNVAKYAMQRTPLAPLMPTFRADMVAGGARKDLALARLALGSTTMAITAGMAQQGYITGNGPVNYDARRILEMSGWKPNSILLGDTYYSISRLDPIGNVLMMSANVTEIIGQASDETEALDIATAATISVANSLTSKTWFRGFSEFLEAYASASADPENKQNVVIKWLERMGASAIPAGVAAYTRTQDSTIRLTDGLVDKVKARLPNYSKDLPPRRNMFGEPIVLEGGLGPDMMSPIYQSKKKNNAVVDEMINNKVDIGMPRFTMDGVELSTIQYDRYVLLSAGEKMPMSLESQLSKLIKSNMYKQGASGKDGSKAFMIESYISDYRSAAKQQLLEEFPALKAKIIGEKIEGQEAFSGQPIPIAVKESLMGNLPLAE
jgi:hypothetical protein